VGVPAQRLGFVAGVVGECVQGAAGDPPFAELAEFDVLRRGEGGVEDGLANGLGVVAFFAGVEAVGVLGEDEVPLLAQVAVELGEFPGGDVMVVEPA
jgi:hypothetical protein